MEGEVIDGLRWQCALYDGQKELRTRESQVKFARYFTIITRIEEYFGLILVIMRIWIQMATKEGVNFEAFTERRSIIESLLGLSKKHG